MKDETKNNSVDNYCDDSHLKEEPEFFYTWRERDSLLLVRNEAERLWHSLAKAHPDANGGSVTVGEGFCIYYKPKGARKARRTFIAYASNNGSLAYEATRAEIEQFLISKGI